MPATTDQVTVGTRGNPGNEIPGVPGVPGVRTFTLVELLLLALLLDEGAFAGALPVLALREAEADEPPFLDLALPPTWPPFWLPPLVPTDTVDRFLLELPAVTFVRSDELAAWLFR